MNPFEMTVIIVAIVMVASVLKAKYRAQRGYSKRGILCDGGAAAIAAQDADADRLRDEVRTLKERIAVLERIATDGDRNRGLELERQIEALRDGRPS